MDYARQAMVNPGLVRDVIENLSPATWYFAMTAYNAAGLESTRTETESMVVNSRNAPN
jgi:hypothetical protein